MSEQKQGTQAAGEPDFIAYRLKKLRLAKGLTLRKLAQMAGISSPSYLLHIENGERVPNEEFAARLARALGEDPEIYRAWARLRSRGSVVRGDLRSMFAAYDMLSRAGAKERGAAETPEPRSPQSTFAPPQLMSLVAPAAAPRLKIPVLRPGADLPGEPDSVDDVIDYLRLPADLHWRDSESAARVIRSLYRPFAYRLTAAQAARGPRLVRGYFAVISGNPAGWHPWEEIDPQATFAVRVQGRIELVSGAVLLGREPIPPELANLGMHRPESLRERIRGKVEFLLADNL